MNRFLPLALLVCFPLSSRACLNDRDSDALAVQNNRFPNALRVISGRFERNPPRFYRMRIARVQNELKSKPRDFALYDDLAVAHDKLGDDETALKIMAQKRALLPVFNSKDKANKEAWYRFYANDGTFRAHRFLRDGAKVERIGEMKRAREEIKRALQIKPNAHFGREKYQFAVMDWIVASKTKKTKASLADFLDNRFELNLVDAGDQHRNYTPPELKNAARGLSGLIVLGAAWRSPDVFHALACCLSSRSTIGLASLALSRTEELLRGGSPSINPKALSLADVRAQKNGLTEAGLQPLNAQTVNDLYPTLRAEAEEWSANRNRFMEANFAQGQHPDTDANFWNGWKDTAPPSLDVEWIDSRKYENVRITGWLLFVAFIVFGVPIFLIGRSITRRRAKRNTSLA